jgi:hypothetical protein
MSGAASANTVISILPIMTRNGPSLTTPWTRGHDADRAPS